LERWQAAVGIGEAIWRLVIAASGLCAGQGLFVGETLAETEGGQRADAHGGHNGDPDQVAV
jgi:hypothetical protein